MAQRTLTCIQCAQPLEDADARYIMHHPYHAGGCPTRETCRMCHKPFSATNPNGNGVCLECRQEYGWADAS